MAKKRRKHKGWPEPAELVRQLKVALGNGKPATWNQLADLIGNVTEVRLRQIAAGKGAVNHRLYQRLLELAGRELAE